MNFWKPASGRFVAPRVWLLLRKTDWRFLFAIFFGVPALTYFIWTTSHFVIAYQATKHAHIFPTSVSSEGWNADENALYQDLPGLASYSSFSKTNSAYIELDASTSSLDAVTPPSAATSTPVEISGPSTTTPVIPPPATNTLPIVPPPVITPPPPEAASTTSSASTSESESGVILRSAPTFPPLFVVPQDTSTSSQQELVLPNENSTSSGTTSPELPLPVIIDAATTSTTTSATSTSMLSRQWPLALAELRAAGEFLFSQLVQTAYATSTGTSVATSSLGANSSSTETTTPAFVQEASSTPSEMDDENIASCTVLAVPCHTIEFAGFAVSGTLLQKEFHGAQVSFSFAGKTPEDISEDGKLYVRYFHAGSWHTAGEVYINKELSNATNGGYFSSTLDGLNAWSNLSDVKIEVEFVRGDERAPVSLYLESLWIDATFKDRVQDVIAGNTADSFGDAPDNVAFASPANIDESKELVLQNGGKIHFPYVNSLGGSLELRADKSSYAAGGRGDETAYFSVTNTSDTKDAVRLYVSLPGGVGKTTDLEEYMHNVPKVSTTTVYDNVTYFCASGWSAATSTATSTEANGYMCAPTHEVQECSQLMDIGTNCFVQGVPIATTTTTSYGSDWVQMQLSAHAQEDSNIQRTLPPGYSIKDTSESSVDIMPGQTVYFKLHVETPDSLSKRFVFSVKGSNATASINSLRLKDENVLSQTTNNKKTPQTMRFNDELSTKNDFNVDELPSFRFKYNTQRSFFTRIFDNLVGKRVPYEVTSAKLVYGDGTREHVPIQVTYGDNGEWQLQVEKKQRAFKPGKYTAEVTVDEGGQTYTDSLDFYWGVLAINSDKSSYKPGENVHFSIASLDNEGNVVCDAQLALTITSPSGDSRDVPVVSGGGCGFNNVTELDDYVADYSTQAIGNYSLALSRLDDNGAVINTISDNFAVTSTSTFVITRRGPTRIYPKAPYTMHFSIAAFAPFNGEVSEVLPEGFVLRDAGGATVTDVNSELHLTWHAQLQPGQTEDFEYTFKAPEVSPYLFLAGPMEMKARDTGVQTFAEPRSWQIASDALPIATGVAWLAATGTTGYTDFSNATQLPLAWEADDYDTTYYSHVTGPATSSSQLTVTKDGDYLVSVTVPMERTDAQTRATQVETDIFVDGAKVNQGVGRESYVERATTDPGDSDHITVLLHNLHANDYIEVYTQLISTINAANHIAIGSQASMYVEYIASTETAFNATATTTTFGTNLNLRAATNGTTSLMWYTDSTNRVDSGYTHVNGPATSSTQIILSAVGSYIVNVNVPVSGALADGRARNRVLLNGVMQNGGEFQQGYIVSGTGITSASNQWSGIVTSTTTNSQLTITSNAANTAAGTLTVGSDVASIAIQKLPSSDVYSARATSTSAATNAWNTLSNVMWRADDIKDGSDYTHSTAGSTADQITLVKSGDYLVYLNESLLLTPAVNRSKPKIQLLIGSTTPSTVTGAQSKGTFSANTSGDGMTSASLVYYLRNLGANSILSVQQSPIGTAGPAIADQNALITVVYKQAQSSWIQDTEAWYQNPSPDSLTPTTRWAGTSNDGDPITTSGDVLSGSVLRLRMALQANTAASAGADTFKLQYAAGDTCSVVLSWTDVGAVGSGSIWRAHDNTSLSGGATLPSNLINSPISATVKETYEESNPSAATPNGASAGADAEWDWSIEDNGAALGTNYCFRMVQGSGQVLKDYNDYPQLITNNSPEQPTSVTPFDNEKLASTSPWFTWNTTDDDGDNIDYEIQVSSTSQSFNGAVDIDQNSVANLSDFDNVSNTGNTAPFHSGDTVRYKDNPLNPSNPGRTLQNGVTYYWRVRGKDDDTGGSFGSSGIWGAWSATSTFTVDTSVTASTWYQAKSFQFNEGTLSNVTATDTVMLSGVNTAGTIWGPAIPYSNLVLGNSWGTVSWSDYQSGSDTIKYQVEYFTSVNTWALVPDVDLTGNSAGFASSPITIAGLDPTTYSTLRVRANFTKVTNIPVLRNWTVSWAYSVNRPTVSTPFDNEAISTTTPLFTFTTTDPASNDLVYQAQWANDYAFSSIVGSSTSNNKQLAPNSGYFYSATTTSDTSPFYSGTKVTLQLGTSTPLTNNNTYWFRVRARPSSTNAYSLWSTPRSFTASTTVDRSTWFQTTTDQFNTGTLVRTVGSNGTLAVAQDTGKVAIYRGTAAGILIGATAQTLPFNTTFRQDDIYSMSQGSSTVLLKSGYYAVMYGLRFDRTDANNSRSANVNYLMLSSSTLPIGWSQSFQRNNGAAMGFAEGGGIIKVTSDATPLVLQSQRVDNAVGTNILQWTINTGAIQLMKLDNNWHYLRLSKTVTQTGPSGASWVPVQYNSEDEVDSSYYSHNIGGFDVTLKNAGHYLVFANTYGTMPSANVANVINQKLTLNGVDVPGSFNSIFVSGSTNQAILEGANSIGMIINATTSNTILNVKVNHTTGASSWTIDKSGASTVHRTALTIVKLPEGDFIRMSTSSMNISPTALTQTFYTSDDEYDTASFSHYDGDATSSRIKTLVSGDYLAFTDKSETLNAGAGAIMVSETGWEKTGGGLLTYGQGGNYTNAAASTISEWSGNIFPSMTSSDYIETYTQRLTATNVNLSASSSIEAVRISSLTEADDNLQTVNSNDIVFSNGAGPRWDAITWSDSKPGSSSILYQLYFYNSNAAAYQLVPNVALTPRNPQMDNGSSTQGTSSSPIDISGLDRVVYGTLRLLATLTCGGGSCPSVNDWTVTWNPGITISGTAKQYDQTTNVTSGTVSLAVNGVLQTQTGTINGSGQWSIAHANVYTGDVVEVFVSDAATSTRAVAITKYSGTGQDLGGMALNQMTLTLGSYDKPTITNADIGMYDYSVSGNGKIFQDTDGSNVMTACATTECYTSRLIVGTSTVYRPSSTSNGNVSLRNLQNNGTIIADGNTIRVSGSWLNSNVFTKNTSTVIFNATSTTETIDSSYATTSGSFYAVTFGETSGTAKWNMQSPISASSTLSINFGTLVPNSTSTIFLSGDLTIGASGLYAKNASTTFMGTNTEMWTDNSAALQDLGDVRIGGASTTVQLASAVKATDLTINSGSLLDASNNNWNISLIGNWTNNNIFVPRTDTVTFLATTSGKTISGGASSFYSMTFNGVSGNWSFTQTSATTTNNFTITNGTVTLPVGTTTVGGNWETFGGTFQHNNGAVLFNSTASGKTIHVATTTPFYDMTFNGSGAWSFSDLNATTSRSVTIQAGTLTMPAGVFAVGGSLSKTGGTLTANSGTLKFTATNAQTIALGGSNAYNMTFNGINGGWTFTDTNATSSNNFRVENGTTTMPVGSLGVGGSFTNANSPSSGFNHSNGIVRFTAAGVGNTIAATGSNFYDVIFNGVGGSWTISGNATSTRNTTFTNASSITLSSGKVLEVDGTFTNLLADAATTWTGALLYLNSGTTYTINQKYTGHDTYNSLLLGTNTNVSMWASSATVVNTAATSSLYSENNASSSGSLYIYGAYTSTGNEFWAYATDFDGTTLSGTSQRAVSVRIASSSVVTLAGSTTIQGISTGTTTIGSQGTGFYSLQSAAGTTSARYYSVGSTTQNGWMFFGGNTIVSTLDNGEFTLITSSSSAIDLGPEVINKNPFLQILYTKFATSSGVVTANNVMSTSSTGGTGNYWWFKNGYGNLYGESYDMDPLGNPGQIQFDDSGITATFSGHVYSDHGATAMGNSVCQTGTTSAKVVFRTSGGLVYSGTCDSSGAFSIPVTFITSNIITAYLNTNGGPRAVTVTKNVTGPVANFDLYQNSIIVRQFDNTPTSVSDMAFNDSTVDSDIPFTATSSLMVQPETELYVWQGKSFSPGADVILQSGGSGDARDGRLYLAATSTYTMTSSRNLALGGGIQIDSGAAFNLGTATTTFTATTSGKTIFSYSPMTFGDVIFNGSGGLWNFNSTSTATTTMRTVTLTAGTVGGVGDVDIQTAGITGSGTISMTGGIFRLEGAGNFGNSNPWQFRNLVFGSGSSNTITSTGAGTTTIMGWLNVAVSQTLQAGSAPWVLFGGGTPLRISGTFSAQTALFWYTATSSTNVTATTYANLFLAPTSSSPTYTILSGTLTTATTTIGDGTNAVTVSATANDPTIDFTKDLVINSSATFVASDLVDMNIEGSWTNSGVFTPSGRAVIFDATQTGKTITPGFSSFYDLTFNSSSGGWTINGNATSTHNTSLSSVSNFTLASGKSLEVGGTFTNSVASSTQTWTSSVLYLNSGTSYTVNTKSNGNATYGTLFLGASTNIRNWNSAAANTVVPSSASLYAQNYASSSGKLYVWGTYSRSSGIDYWDYATDFDGISLGNSHRKVDVFVASSSQLTFSGGSLDIIGATTASTTVQVQTSGTYGLSVGGSATLNAQYYEVRNTDPNGLYFTGNPTISGLGNGDFLSGASGNSMITVSGTVIGPTSTVFKYDKFATSSGVVTGYNVTSTSSASGGFWKFNSGYGNLYGESYDNDIGGDPGQIRFDDSSDHINISGTVYKDDGAAHEDTHGCDGFTAGVRLKVQGAGSYSATCNSGTGAFTISNVGYNPGDVFTLYLASTSVRSATVMKGATTSVSNIDIYEHRVIVRHEDTTPITIADLDQYDSDADSLIPFKVTLASPNALSVEANTKLLVWSGKTFAPAGNVTVNSGGVNSWDGTLELMANSTFSASGAQSHSFGGSFLVDSGATFTAANSTVTFTATTTGKTISPSSSAFYNITFNGTGGNWAFSGGYATSTNDFTITTGTVTLPTSVLEVGGSFLNAGGAFQHNNGLVKMTSTAVGKSIQVNSSPFYNLTADGTTGAWSFVDAVATTSNNFVITHGTVTAPATLNAGGSFSNSGTFSNNNGTVKMTANNYQTITAGGSDFYNLSFTGIGGGWAFLDQNATTTRNFVAATGTVTMASGTVAVGGNFNTASTTFISNNGVVKFTATTTGFNINVGTSTFYQLLFDAVSGGWIIGSNATSTASTTITNAASFTLASGKSLEVDGAFTNSVSNAATTWTNSTLYLNSGTSYSINTRSNNGDTYAQLTVGNNSQIRSWNSSAATTSAGANASVYSQNDSGTSGSLYIYGTYSRTSGTDYWSGSTDFDGTSIAGVPRQANVRIATSSSVSFSSATLNIVGSSTASTTIYASGTGSYGFTFSGGTLNAQYYDFKNMDSNGVVLSGAPVISSLNNGAFEMSAASGTIMQVAASVIDANSNLIISAVKMSTTSANLRGFNVYLTSTPGNFWTFIGGYGNFTGESHDADGTSQCGHIRWDDSDCQFVNEAHYRFRNDDGGEGALSSTWYDSNWTRREKIVINNPNATAYTNLPVKIIIPYDSDMLSTFNDLRFTDSSGTSSIPFWREYVNASASSTVWVKIASLPASGSATIYAYYGNAGAASADDGSNTFTYLKDFEDSSIAEFSGDTALFAVSNSTSYGTGSHGLVSNGSLTAQALYLTGSQTGTGKTIRWFQNVQTSPAGDEPCTLFGVQSPNPGSGDYAVCLDNNTNVPAGLAPRLSIVQDTRTRDVAGTVLASTSASWTSGWYQVAVDWISGSPKNTISVNVYDVNGDLFKSLSTTSSTYSSGGVGYSYLNQHGGWDDYMVKTYTPSAPTYVFGAEQQNNGATWEAAEDTAATSVLPNKNIRLRFSVQNTGTSVTGHQYRLQYASKGVATNCESVDPLSFNDVPVYNSCASGAICMASSTQITTLGSTSPSLSYPASMNFTPGYIVQDPYNTANPMALANNYATELEYTFKITNSAAQPAYCFRVSNGGTDLANYDKVAEADIAYPPYLTNFTLNNAADIALTEATSTIVYASSTVTDNNGYTDISFATSTIYRSGVTNGASCAASSTNCYQMASTSCLLSNCSGNSCTLQCVAYVQYFADRTDIGTYAAQNWLATVAVQDSTGLRDTENSLGVEMLSLRGLSIYTGNIDFGALQNNQNTGTKDATTTITNTGNSPIDVQVSGTDLIPGAGTHIDVTQQKYATTTFAYGSCAICAALSGSAANVNVSIPQTSATTSSSTQDVYWGLNVPNGVPADAFTGSNTFTAVAPPGG